MTEAYPMEMKDQELKNTLEIENGTGVRNRFTNATFKGKPLKPGHGRLNIYPNIKFPEENLKRIDYILIYPNKTLDELPESSSAYKDLEKKIKLRETFEQHLLDEGFEMQIDSVGENVFIKLHTPFSVLCREAEECHIEMPLAGKQIYDESAKPFWKNLEDKYLVTDTELDFVSAPFQVERLHLYERSDNADTFFRPAMRSFLTHHILINLDIRNEKEEEDDPFSKKGLQWMLMKSVYSDAFNLHDETSNDPKLKEDMDAMRAHMGSRFLRNEDDPLPEDDPVPGDNRQELSRTWAKKWIRYQPLWKIRNYFGEKIALYFAWSGTLISTLILPTILGLAIFIYGLVVSVRDEYFSNNNDSMNNNTANITTAERIADEIADLVGVFQKAFDNEATPYFGLIMCLWGTVFLEMWKRKNYTLAYEWDVENFENTEPDRPEFYGTKMRQDPIVPEEFQWFYPIWNKIAKYALSAFVLLVMVLLVLLCVAVVVLYRVFMTVDYCGRTDNPPPTINCLIVATLLGSILQAVFIMVLGKIYDKISLKLTNWENHRTQTEYNDALIIKLFAFQFVNSYASLYYIAFFRGRIYSNGIFNLGPEYQDSCGSNNNCMSMLSLQVLILMVAKPLPKFLKDIILPWVQRLWRTRIKPCVKKCCCCSNWCNKVQPTRNSTAVQLQIEDYMERERLKPTLGDFTLMEYQEKVLVYGFLMLFCVSLPLGPLIALLVNLVDIRVDARRMLWWYRRPVAVIAQDIGRWYAILQVLNIIGVITNAFLIAYVSQWGTKYANDPEIQLWIVLGFEHVVFMLKFLLATLIPDIPQKVRLAMKREKYQVHKILQEAREQGFGDVAQPPRETFGRNMMRPSVLDDLAVPPPNGDLDMLMDEGARRKHKKKHKKNKKRQDKFGEEDRTTHTDTHTDGRPQLSARDSILSTSNAPRVIFTPASDGDQAFSGQEGAVPDVIGPAHYTIPMQDDAEC